MGVRTLTTATGRATWLTVALTLGTPVASHAQASGAGRPAMPSRMVVVADACGARAIDVGAFAEALRVELAQEGVSAVDVAEAGAPNPDDPRVATLRVHAAPCEADATALVFELDAASSPASALPTLPIKDVGSTILPRVAALAVAERLRTAWARPSGAWNPMSGQRAETTVAAGLPSDSQRPVQQSRTAPEASHAPPSPHVSDSTPPPVAKRRAQTDLLLAAALEWRLFSGPASAALLGPRALLLSHGMESIPLRVQCDIGAAFGSVNDSLGDIELTIATGGVGLAWFGRPGPVRLEIGPRVELGWAEARGLPSRPSVSGGAAGAFLAIASMSASAWTDLAGPWRGMLELDIGATIAGLDARADGRPVGEIQGAMLGTRIGVGRAF